MIFDSLALLKSPIYNTARLNSVKTYDLGAGPNGYHDFLISGEHGEISFALIHNAPELPESFYVIPKTGQITSSRLGLYQVDFEGRVVEHRWIYLLVDCLIASFVFLFGFFLFERRGLRAS
jgi:hypothetical protein